MYAHVCVERSSLLSVNQAASTFFYPILIESGHNYWPDIKASLIFLVLVKKMDF